MSTHDLTHAEIWLSRPAGQNAEWQEALQAAGGRTLVEPLLEIGPPDDESATAQSLAQARSADIVIVASRNAVARARYLQPAWRPQGHVIAVGRASAQAMTDYIGRRVEVPAQFDTEGMLALPSLQHVKACRIVLLAGHGGRQKLRHVLQARGAQVDKIALYRRYAASIDRARLDRLLAVDMMVVTSTGAWQVLMEQLTAEQCHRLGQVQLVGASHNMVKKADMDICWAFEPIVIDRMDASGAVATLARLWRARTRKGGR